MATSMYQRMRAFMGTPVASSPSANLATPSSPTTPTASASARSATAALVDDPSKRSNNHPSSTLSSVAVVVPAPSKGLHEKKVESESHTLPKKRERAALAPPAAKTDHTIDRHVVQDEDSESESEQTDEESPPPKRARLNRGAAPAMDAPASGAVSEAPLPRSAVLDQASDPVEPIVKRSRGRPRKVVESMPVEEKVRRPVGRPRKEDKVEQNVVAAKVSAKQGKKVVADEFDTDDSTSSSSEARSSSEDADDDDDERTQQTKSKYKDSTSTADTPASGAISAARISRSAVLDQASDPVEPIIKRSRGKPRKVVESMPVEENVRRPVGRPRKEDKVEQNVVAAKVFAKQGKKVAAVEVDTDDSDSSSSEDRRCSEDRSSSEDDDDDEQQIKFDLEIKSKYKDYSFITVADGAKSGTNQYRLSDLVAIDRADWIGEIKAIRGLKSDITTLLHQDGTPQLSSTGKPKDACYRVWIKVRWMYSADQFSELAEDWRWQNTIPSFGRNECIPTSSTDWYDSGSVFTCKPIHHFHFDDRYPSTKIGHELSHPLSHKHRQARFPHVVFPNPPSYLFDDQADNKGKVQKWSRVSFFDFHIPAGAKGRQLDATRLIFNRYPSHFYNPSTDIQHFSMQENAWINRSTLSARKSYAPIDSVAQVERRMKDGRTSLSLSFLRRGDDNDDSSSETGASNDDESNDESATGLGSLRSTLLALSKCTIYRGQYFGVIGNAYLVIRAGELVRARDRQDNSISHQAAAQQLIDDARAWKAGSERRRKALLKMRGEIPERHMLPEGMAWVCPVSNRAI